MKAIYLTEPETISYMPLPDGKADVWLRKNIAKTTDDEGNTCWECDEVSFRTSLSQGEIEENFEAIFENGGPVVDEEAEEEVSDGATLKDRVEALEESQLEMAELMAELLG